MSRFPVHNCPLLTRQSRGKAAFLLIPSCNAATACLPIGSVPGSAPFDAGSPYGRGPRRTGSITHVITYLLTHVINSRKAMALSSYIFDCGFAGLGRHCLILKQGPSLAIERAIRFPHPLALHHRLTPMPSSVKANCSQQIPLVALGWDSRHLPPSLLCLRAER